MKKLYLLILSALIFSLASCNDSENDKRVYLNKTWSYSLEGEFIGFSSLKISQLPALSILVPQKRGYIWLRTTFYLSEELRNEELSLYMGAVSIADSVYINGHFVGKTGFFPPYEYPQGEKPSSFSLPDEYLNFGGENTVLIKLWVNGYGKISSIPFISTYSDVMNKQVSVDFLQSKAYLLCSYFMLLVSAIYFFLYILRKREHSNLSFSRLNFFSALYLVTVYYAEYPIIYKIGYSFLLFEKIFHGAASIFAVYFYISFVRDYFDRTESKARRIYRIASSLISVFVLFSARSISEFLILLEFVYIIVTINVLYTARILIEAFIKKDKKVYTYTLAFSPLLLCLVLQTLSHFILKTHFSVLLIIISWIVSLFSFIGILLVSFVKMTNRVEYMNKNLELLVQERTKELESEKNRAEQEIELASFVQQSFYRQDITDFDDWEANYYSKAMAGVSGDLYDFFKDNKKLLGLCIFDVSGHGIASGLVTMLVKNIIQQEFYAGLNNRLDDVLSLINSRIIIEKGNIENYLTGILLRIKGSQLEMVNAGHPKAVLYKAKTKETIFLENENIMQDGVIGIPDFPISVDPIYFEMENGDELLLYTDGITETENKQNEFYGKDRLINNFAKLSDLSVREQIDAIRKSVFDFAGKDSLSDDITFIILRKK